MNPYYKLELLGAGDAPKRVELYTSEDVANTIGKMHIAKCATNSYNVYSVYVSEEVLITS